MELIKYRKLINASLTAIWKEWEVDRYPGFLDMMSVPLLSWNIQKHKFIRLLMENHYNNISGSSGSSGMVIPGPSPRYVMGYSGSSVTAGHDNYFNESFPFPAIGERVPGRAECDCGHPQPRDRQQPLLPL